MSIFVEVLIESPARNHAILNKKVPLLEPYYYKADKIRFSKR